MKLSIFILAAGLGERLRPITNYLPKPLVPLLGRPILQTVLEKVSDLRIDKTGINLHHKKAVIETWINQSAFANKITLFPEDPVLGTGGALKNAEDFLKDGLFVVHNSDIISDINIETLIECHLSSGNLATLAVHDYSEFNKLAIDEKGLLRDVGNPVSDLRNLAFTGIAAYSPEFLKLLPSGISSVVDTWEKAAAMGHKIGVLDVSGCDWTDIGTPASYAKAVFNELRRNGETVYVHPSITWCGRVQMDGHVVIEKESSCDRVSILKNCIILPGTNIGRYHGEGAGRKYYREEKQLSLTQKDFRNSRSFTRPAGQSGEGGHQVVLFENCILGPGFEIDLAESDLFGSTDCDAVLIGQGGSDRKYYRVKKDGESAVLMQCSKDDQDFQRHIEYTRFFQKYLIPVPELIDADIANKSALFEDVGDISLYSWLKCPRRREQMEEIYKRVIDILVLIHTTATAHIAECSLLKDRIFDYEHLRWETGYFIERFAEAVRNVSAGSPALKDDFHRLATMVDSFPKTIIHRDFQSQNVMVIKGEIPRLLDFQGARIGPPAYDVASVLWDPYCSIKENLRDRLLYYYISQMRGVIQSFREDEFIETLLPCRLQRHMQALGAYGFLSAVKGKTYFMKYVPKGLRLLKEDATLAKKEYPALHTLVKDL